MSIFLCAKCGHELRAGNAFCPRCGTPTKAPRSSQPSQSMQVTTQTSSNKGRVLIIALLILLILIVPVFPRDRVVYVDGVTQIVTMSTSYSTSIQTYANSTPMQVSFYQGTLRYVPDQYYNYYFNYQNYYGYPSYRCYQYGYYYCSYPYYYYNPYYNNGYNYGYYLANTVTVKPSDNVIQVQQSQESNGFSTLTLTHLDGTSFTCRHVFQQSLAQSSSSIILGTVTVTSTITNSVVNPVTNAKQCQRCILQHVTDHVNLLQLIFGV
jgi:hypothetical protein